MFSKEKYAKESINKLTFGIYYSKILEVKEIWRWQKWLKKLQQRNLYLVTKEVML